MRLGKTPALPPGGASMVFAPDVGEGQVLAEERGCVGSRYILCESYHSMPEIAQLVQAEAGLHKPLPPSLPIPVARGFAAFGEWMAGFTHRPPMLAAGQLTWLLWQVRPCSKKAQRDLGWKPTPYREGLRQTLLYLSGQPKGTPRVGGAPAAAE
jgi:nucleoside-diphosphate-sugar epimerase